jgi:Icc-related predicted phosphoesterase
MSDTLKIVAISDLHGTWKLGCEVANKGASFWPAGDVLIIAGDVFDQNSEAELVAFNMWLGQLPYELKIYVPGNHDLYVEAEPERADELLTNAILLIDKSYTYRDVKFYGSPWTIKFNHWSFMKLQGEMYPIWSRIPEDTTVLITHGPADGFGDVNMHDWHVGDVALSERLRKIGIPLHIFGHVHECGGQVFHSGCHTFANVALLDEYYTLARKPTVLKVRGKKVVR